MIDLRSGSATCTIEPGLGGRVATLTVDGVDLIVGPDDSLPSTGWGSYPMVPWAGRIRRGTFRFEEREHRMPINFEQHAIHGTGFQQAWDVVEADDRHAILRCQLAWDFGGSSEQHIELTDTALQCTLSVTAEDTSMPATVGWHPWFVKPERTELQFQRMYLRDDDYIADGRYVEPPPPPPWDDCFAGPLQPVRLWIGGTPVTLTSDCDFWVVYDMPSYATCVEPQSGLPDAFNLPAEVGGVSSLSPGQTLERKMAISWEA